MKTKKEKKTTIRPLELGTGGFYREPKPANNGHKMENGVCVLCDAPPQAVFRSVGRVQAGKPKRADASPSVRHAHTEEAISEKLTLGG